jgi:hypothetical protein
MAALDGKLYLVAGRKILRIQPTGGVSFVAYLPASLVDPAVAAIRNRLVIVGGGTRFVYSVGPA